MDKTFIPQPIDEGARNEASATKTAAFAGTTFDHGTNFAPGGCGMPMGIVIDLSALSGTGTFTLTPYESNDDSSFRACGPAVDIAKGGSLTLGSTVTAGVMCVPFFQSQRYTRGSITLAGAGTLTLQSWLTPNVSPRG